MVRAFPALPALVLVAACGGDPATPADAPEVIADAPPDAPTTRVLVAALPVTPNHQLDLLFVIDDSSGMDLYQARLAQAMPVLVQVLRAVPGGAPDVHIGVVTTDLGVSSTDDPTPGPDQGTCRGTGKAGDLQASLTDLGDGSQLGIAVQRGAGGCGFEQSLAAMARGLDGHNAELVRTSAALGVVFLTNEDDCSARSNALFDPDDTTLGPFSGFRCIQFGIACNGGGTTPAAMATAGAKTDCRAIGTAYIAGPSQFYADLRALKPDPRDVAVAGWFGPATPVVVDALPATSFPPSPAHSEIEGGCKEMIGNELLADFPAVRMHDFLGLFPDQSYEAPICPHDEAPALGHIAQLFARRAGSPCLDREVAGITHCIAEDVTGTARVRVGFHLVVDAATCPLDAHQKLVVDRVGAADPAATTELHCEL